MQKQRARDNPAHGREAALRRRRGRSEPCNCCLVRAAARNGASGKRPNTAGFASECAPHRCVWPWVPVARMSWQTRRTHQHASLTQGIGTPSG